MVREQIPFLMEVVLGTAADRKGGHLARRLSDGQLVLRETAQTPPEDEESFRDFERWRYYNTNSLWIDLEALAARFVDGAPLELPVIVNRKTVDPRDSDSPNVLQLESAMGAAIGSFPGARLLQVPRSRFVPVKTTDDLLLLRSDAYTLGDGFRVEPAPETGGRTVHRLGQAVLRSDRWVEQRLSEGRRRCARPSGWWSRATSASVRTLSSVGTWSSRRPTADAHRRRTVLSGE